jgi:hypothetical protein
MGLSSASSTRQCWRGSSDASRKDPYWDFLSPANSLRSPPPNLSCEHARGVRHLMHLASRCFLPRCRRPTRWSKTANTAGNRPRCATILMTDGERPVSRFVCSGDGDIRAFQMQCRGHGPGELQATLVLCCRQTKQKSLMNRSSSHRRLIHVCCPNDGLRRVED